MIVLKFGGSSVANISRMRRIAQRVVEDYIKRGEQIIIVVSAMQGETDRLNGFLSEFPLLMSSERDVILSSGEPIATALLALVFQELGYPAQSFLGWQLPIITDAAPSNARLIDISVGQIHHCFSHNIIPIVAGFQGITEQSRITTLGRGGSDATAVALAAVMHAQCDIYTDVDGVYTADPRIVPQAQRHASISYEEMFEMAFQGAKVLQARSVELAMKHRVPIHVLSSFVEGEGTRIVENKNMEQLTITGITQKSNIAHCCLQMERAKKMLVLEKLYELGILIDWVMQNDTDDHTLLSFLVPLSDAEVLKERFAAWHAEELLAQYAMNTDVAKISVVGIGIGSRPQVVQTIVRSLKEIQIPVHALTVSPLSVGVLMPKPHIEIALNTLHSLFEWSE